MPHNGVLAIGFDPMALFVPNLPENAIRCAFQASPGNEMDSKKFEHPESSAALAANAFGWFLNRPDRMPAIFGQPSDWPAVEVRLEAEMRFPWSGGMHAWLDAVVVTKSLLIGVESKRYEPFRSKPKVRFSAAYDRPCWGHNMRGFCAVKDALKSGELEYQTLDAAQLVKHAFGIRSQVHRSGDYQALRPVLLYLFAEPTKWPSGRSVAEDKLLKHREEIQDFKSRVLGDEVELHNLSYQSLLSTWISFGDTGVSEHAANILDRFTL